MICNVNSHTLLVCHNCKSSYMLSLQHRQELASLMVCSNWPRLIHIHKYHAHKVQVLSCFLCFHIHRGVAACMLLPSAHQHATVSCRSPTIWCLGMAWTCDCPSSKSPASQFDGLTVSYDYVVEFMLTSVCMHLVWSSLLCF